MYFLYLLVLVKKICNDTHMNMQETESGHCCPVYKIIETLSKKWSLHVLRSLADNGKMRFSDFQEQLPEINSRMLSERLTELEGEGLIERNVLDTKPITVEYQITEKGEDLKSVFKGFCAWGKKWGKQS